MAEEELAGNEEVHEMGKWSRTGIQNFIPLGAVSRKEEASERNRKRDPEGGLSKWVWLGGGLGVLAVAALFLGSLGWRQSRVIAEETEITPNLSFDDFVVAHESLKREAAESFARFLAEEDALGKCRWLLGETRRLQELEDYLESGGRFPVVTEGDQFHLSPMVLPDLKKGYLAIQYVPVELVELSLEKPILPSEVSSGAEAPGFLEEATMASVTVQQGRPNRAALLVYQRRGERLLLDWEIFFQTWNRRLAAFRDGDLGDGPMRFCVLVSEDVAVSANGETRANSIFRIEDPVHEADHVRVEMMSFDPSLGPMRPVTTGQNVTDPLEMAKPRAATLDLKRDPKSGKVVIARFVGWGISGFGDGVDQYAEGGVREDG
ncbi:hypothetical protein HNR46_001982 [Haloferula luteola]|uniref:Uncharacterized protein n=2 Tax=Haloferula luteola TaxID=595692 RepID=A0A840V2P7_9BACT|nr:hypothetical protein [Haloferula luteola]